MQLRPWLVASLTLNVALLLLLGWTRREAGAAISSDAPAPALRGASLASGEGSVGVSAPQPAAVSHDRASLLAMRDALRAAGVAPEQIEQVLSALLQKQRHRAKRASSWWKGSPYSSSMNFADPLEMHRDGEELRRLMDDEASPVARATKELESSLDYLPGEKRAKVVRVLSDYAEVGARHAAGGLQFSADHARAELLRAELQRDLRAILTEEEYFEHTLRDLGSMEWVRLRSDAAALNLTEQEFRETARALSTARALPDETARMKAVEQIHAELRERVGEDRIFDARARNTHDYYQLRQAQVRFGFEQAATDEVVASWRRASEAAEALRGADEAARKPGWRALAEESRKEIRAILGDEAGGAYLEQAMPWLRDWDRGEDTRWAGIMGKQ